MLSLADLPADIQHKVVHIAVRDGLAVHAELGKRAVHAVAPPLLLALVGGLAVHSQHIEAVLALCALDEVFLLERAAQVLFVGVDGEGRVIAVQVVDVDGDLLTALLRLRLVCLPNDERGSRQHKHDDEGDDAFVVFLLHFAFSFSC